MDKSNLGYDWLVEIPIPYLENLNLEYGQTRYCNVIIGYLISQYCNLESLILEYRQTQSWLLVS